MGALNHRLRETIVTTSWDDGQKTDLKLADLLARYNVKGTFYVTKTYRDPLGREEILKISEGHEIGSHTLTHPNLTRLALPEARKEIEGSKKYLEDILKCPVKMFSYPYGDYNDDIARLVRDAGYGGARTCNMGGPCRPGDPYKWQAMLPSCCKISIVKLFRYAGANTRSLHSLIGQGLGKKELLDLIINRKLDWEAGAKMLFDVTLESGGVYHLWGHAGEVEAKGEWRKLESVLRYISTRKGVCYMTNGEVFDYFTGLHDQRGLS